MVLQKLTQYSRAITPHQSKGKIKNFNIAKSIDKIILKKTDFGNTYLQTALQLKWTLLYNTKKAYQ